MFQTYNTMYRSLHHCYLLPGLLLFILTIASCFAGESSTCLTVYKEGGAPAVFRSPKCPRWKLSDFDSTPTTPPSSCQTAVLKGRRETQEDRIFCALDVRIPFPSAHGVRDVVVGMLAVFDGHNGAEASDMASKLLLKYLVLHTYFLLDATFSCLLKLPKGRMLSNNDDKFVQERVLPLFDRKRSGMVWRGEHDVFFHLEILKESLTRAIQDVDASFSKEAYKHNLDSGSTATVILLADGQILVANLGDSKAVLCSEEFLSPPDARTILLSLCEQKIRNGLVRRFRDCGDLKMMTSNGLTHLSAKDLTRDHRPDRDDEKSRVEMAGGYVLEWGGVPRVNGQLAVSRAIGDVAFKSYGVTSAPEVTDWQPLTSNDSYVVAASDGVFQTLNTQDVCTLLWEAQNEYPLGSQVSSMCSSSLADCIVQAAFKRGSTDNIAAIVVPLRSTGYSNSMLDRRSAECEDSGYAFSQSGLVGLQDGLSSGLVQQQHAHPIFTKFDTLLVEVKQGTFGCFYLSENLKENNDNVLRVMEDEREETFYDLSHALPAALDLSCSSGFINLYKGKNLCLQYEDTLDGNKDQSIYPKAFNYFFGLLESIPWHTSGSSFGSFENVRPNMRYKLNKRFGRGAYGEVWLAFHWNCGTLNRNKTNSSSVSYVKLESFDENSGENTNKKEHGTGAHDDDMFILKRIMVERGSAVYLSGLREKYYGELFLNGSAYFGSPLLSSLSKSAFQEYKTGLYDVLKRRNVVAEDNIDIWSGKNVIVNESSTQGTINEEGLSHIARYVESFESRSGEIWLVFRHEGISLSKLMYTTEVVKNHEEAVQSEGVKHAQVLHPSKWWHWLKTTKAGQKEMKNLIWQLLTAVKSCHDRNITHRDIKPENMVICVKDPETGRCLLRSPVEDIEHPVNMRIIDFGSAIDDFTLKYLYGSAGPSRFEQTYDYTPPEALLNSSWYRGPTSRSLKYDMWSVGVVILELVLGSPDVFQMSTLSRALLDKYIESWNEDLKELAYKLRSFMEMCILISGRPTKNHHNGGSKEHAEVSPASWKCSEEFFSNLIKSRDPLKIGFSNVWEMRLVRQLLLWDPDDRLSVDDALRHPYFHPPS